MQLAIVIMAAGKGTRLKSRRPKVLHQIGGRALAEHVIAAAAQVVEPKDIYVVIGHEAEAVRAALRHTGVRFVVQAEQRGTGHAIQTAKPEVEGYENLIVLSGDAPMIRTETILRLRDFHLEQQAAMTVLTTRPADPTGYGRVVRKAAGKPEVIAIVEQKALKPEQLSAPEINSGIYAFRAEPLFKHIGELSTDNAHGEYYLTDMAALLVKAKERVVALETADVHEVLGANTIAEMMELDAEMRMRKAQALMAEGVTIFRPETSVIDSTVTVGADTIVEPFVQLLGRTKIGSGCRIRSYSVIEDSTIGDDVLVRNGSVIGSSLIAKNALIGPYSHLRPESEIGEGAHVGNFVETKKSRLGAGAKANHLSYIGDAEVGAGTNIGAGTITCNYDGKGKHRTTIGANVFVGSDSTLVAPLAIADGSYIAAGSTITEDVPADALALGRARQTTKPDWAKKMRSRK
ncbi:MAG: bifunctional UDP-N-acetylglucosamine pyrophosphorylase / glucosamine-phosphate N-acetyltransferase [Acidobacteriaceae bacterium]|jgi:bifunctional UDP-N-acetylglucosamine pyrophosphorylase/glucosamine-1-phosphate N-acetyltransferase|nr:bifunctional UDP-N-acetylglucosamine pyrophosphorylase / glucosamine-phosphate N-acetyltransferase [Acidobacteriaceae bacterium]